MIHRDKTIDQPKLDIYPLVIICDRYNGQYSGGKYIAWNVYPEYLPKDPDDGDFECEEFWSSYTGIVGKGYTPDEALEDLAKELYKNKKK